MRPVKSGKFVSWLLGFFCCVIALWCFVGPLPPPLSSDSLVTRGPSIFDRIGKDGGIAVN